MPVHIVNMLDEEPWLWPDSLSWLIWCISAELYGIPDSKLSRRRALAVVVLLANMVSYIAPSHEDQIKRQQIKFAVFP